MFINATGFYVPEERVDNQHFLELNGLTSEWIEQRTGIRSRSKAKAEENINTMSMEAVRNALPKLPYDITDVDLIVSASYSPYDTVALGRCGCGLLHLEGTRFGKGFRDRGSIHTRTWLSGQGSGCGSSSSVRRGNHDAGRTRRLYPSLYLYAEERALSLGKEWLYVGQPDIFHRPSSQYAYHVQYCQTAQSAGREIPA